jgi:hypothetical protein
MMLPLLFLFLMPQDTTPQPTRSVKDNVIHSTEKPAIKLRVDKSFQYVGSQAFILYGNATAEQHFFVEADADKKMSRFYWVQFEGYMPGNTHTYRYNSKTKAKLGDFEFYADAAPRKLNNQGRPDSDGARAQAFLKSKGYTMKGNTFLSQRLVHLVDDKKRDELMIIYVEDLASTGHTFEDISPGGKAHDQWEGVAKELLKRALQGMSVEK